MNNQSIAAGILDNAPDNETHAIASAACSKEHFLPNGIEYTFPDRSVLVIKNNGIIEAITPRNI